MVLGVVWNASNQKTDSTFTLKLFETVNFAFMWKNYLLVKKHRKVNFFIFLRRFTSSNFSTLRTRTYARGEKFDDINQGHLKIWTSDSHCFSLSLKLLEISLKKNLGCLQLMKKWILSKFGECSLKIEWIVLENYFLTSWGMNWKDKMVNFENLR